LDFLELKYVTGAFAAFLVVILCYVLIVDARGRKLRKELERVRKMVGSDKRE